MSNILVVGSIGLDTIDTPFGKRENILGGAATLFSLSASCFTKINLVSVVGNDFPQEHTKLFTKKGVNIDGLEVKREGRTFRWHGRYRGRMNTATTVSVDLNVLGDFKPTLPQSFRETPYLFLGNGSPHTQMAVLEQMSKKPKFILLDTMNFWIETEHEKLLELIKHVDGICINYEEALMLMDKNNFAEVVEAIQHFDIKVLIIKKAEHGAVLITQDTIFSIPSYPTISIKDPTGAGDAFAGGFLGYIAKTDNTTIQTLKHALIYGTVMGSFAIEDFGTERLQTIKPNEIEERYHVILDMIRV
ncbi:MAG: hypothetical protein A2W05_11615 [Candidatus Schekmanbacteria bacterium RBG_16_38_10]|uniref:Carbohydrate kinase PfkB domain-containing protein n=1 Tax=Candidatus Schekmanbacteria bacterium RBG_16_38_10 TaxID=1817879 RepID=A0A1F7RXY6_9BACT|nr:MAG: hypothetical protein A2W05_11615 [Candidatus Schekmanbacteria bacterium RBG_16_38_10]